jgi:asparagine synthase (glutamine-hydrolysing)
MKLPKYPKSLLVESIAPALPDAIVHRKKKGFVLPWETWMRGELRELCETRINGLADRGILNPGQLKKKWNAFVGGAKGVKWSELWHLIVLSEWLENNKF